MACSQCQGLESLFDNKTAAKELKEYRLKGPKKTTRLLIKALEAEGVQGLTLLDIGGGVGAIQHELLRSGAESVTNVDASAAYIEAARQEARRQGTIELVSYHYADFIDLAEKMGQADIVTLDRAICCYPDMSALVGLSAAKARKMYGLVYPQDTWWLKWGAAAVNFGAWLLRKPYRFFIHSSTGVEDLLGRQGFSQRFKHKTFIWQTVVYAR
jgi:magnesium-protoporphyrin O-methyltransferase